MNDEAFVAAIEASPDNAELKLVCADWLEERGDPRAELVRLDGELWRTPIDLMRVRAVQTRRIELRGACDPRWIVRRRGPRELRARRIGTLRSHATLTSRSRCRGWRRSRRASAAGVPSSTAAS